MTATNSSNREVDHCSARPRADMRRPFHIAFIVFALSYPANCTAAHHCGPSAWSVWLWDARERDAFAGRTTLAFTSVGYSGPQTVVYSG